MTNRQPPRPNFVLTRTGQADASNIGPALTTNREKGFRQCIHLYAKGKPLQY
jgi:hypothetical protein